MTLFNRIRQTQNSLSQDTLAQTDIRYTPRPGDVRLPRDLALLVIDVQKEFCDPEGKRGNRETRDVSQRIRQLVPAFRKAGVPVYVIYFSDDAKRPQDVDFYEFRPEKGDFLLRKDDDSAFRGSDLDALLKKHDRKTLLACGFNLNACIFHTVMDARAKGYPVRLLRDLSGNDKNNDASSTKGYLKRMTDEGVVITSAADELRALAAAQPGPPEKQTCRPRTRPGAG
jgi:ureidoacrylate peracid hydrolase